MKKLTLEFIKEEIEKFGYKCLSEEYFNSWTKLKIQCDKGHIYEANWHNFKSNKRCLICSGRKKKTLKEINTYAKKFGYRCLSKEYINNRTKLEFQCKRGHIYNVSWDNLRKGVRCPYCAGVKRKTIEEVRQYVEKFGYKCLSEKYINNSTKLELQCEKGHIYKSTWGRFERGRRCQICAGNKRKTIEEIKEYVKKFGYRCLSKKYINNSTKLEFQCNEGHIYKVVYSSFYAGCRCPICYGNKKKTLKEIQEYVNKFGYKCLSKEYINNHTRLKLECNRSHTYKVVWNSIKSGARCPICYIENNVGENHPSWKNYTEEDRKNIELYVNEVKKLTEINYKIYKDSINPNNLTRNSLEYHIDHIYSVADGFRNTVEPKVIANPNNLRMMWYSDNISKNDSSDVTIEQLYILYDKFVAGEIYD